MEIGWSKSRVHAMADWAKYAAEQNKRDTDTSHCGMARECRSLDNLGLPIPSYKNFNIINNNIAPLYYSSISSAHLNFCGFALC
eukprot:1153215-Pelagomonas_calceolata.AAC.5